MNHLNLILQFRYLILIPLMLVEGPAITFIAGFLVFRGYFEADDILLIAILSNLGGDIWHYLFGRWGRIGLIRRWGHYAGISPARVTKMEVHFKKHGGKTLLFGKVALAFGSVTLVTAGIARFPFWKFLFYSVLGEIPKTLLFFVLGYYFGTAYSSFRRYLLLSTIAMILIAIVLYVYYRMSRETIAEIGEE